MNQLFEDCEYNKAFKLKPDLLEQIVSTAKRSFDDRNREYNVRISINQDTNTLEVNSAKDLISESQNNKIIPILQLRVYLQSIDNRKQIENNDIIKCTIDFGDKSTTSTQRWNIKLIVEGDRKWRKELFNDVDAQLNRCLINELPYRISKIVSMWKSKLQLITLFLFLIGFLWFGIGLRFAPQDPELSIINQQLNTLYVEAEDRTSIESKISFLYQERILIWKLATLSSARKALLQINFDFLITGQIIIALSLVLLLIHVFANYFPQENYLWGDYEEHFNNLEKKREWWIGVIVIAMLVNIVTGLFF